MSLAKSHRHHRHHRRQAQDQQLAHYDPTADALQLLQLPIDVKESTDRYQIVADLPGVPKENLKVTVKDHVLTITGSRERVEEHESRRYHVEERVFGTVSRSIALPEDANEDSVTGKFEHGVLNLVITKYTPHPEEGIRNITIA